MAAIKKVYRNGPCKLKVEADTNRCLYRYDPIFHVADVSCEYDLLSMVGGMYQPFYREIIEQHGLVIKTVEVLGNPWVYDKVVDVQQVSREEDSGLAASHISKPARPTRSTTLYGRFSPWGGRGLQGGGSIFRSESRAKPKEISVNEGYKMTTFRLRLPKGDVEAVKDIARVESCKRQDDIRWTDLVRSALRVMVRERRPIE